MPSPAETTRAYALLFVMPLFFSSNLVLGRAAVEAVDPFTLAFFRWFLAFLIILPVAWVGIAAHKAAFAARSKPILLLGFLGMWICGAIVYLSLKVTTATNATLIYTTSPVFVVLIEAVFRGRRVGALEMVGIVAAMLGVGVIVLRGDLGALARLDFSIGDVGILVCAFAWAVYSVILKQEGFRGLPTIPLFAVIAAAGSLILAPFMIAESIALARFPATVPAWVAMIALAIVPSILAFSTYQYGVKIVGPTVTSVFLYFLPVYGVGLAVVFLGERLAPFHLVGMVLVVIGVVAATLPPDLAERLGRRLRPRRAP